MHTSTVRIGLGSFLAIGSEATVRGEVMFDDVSHEVGCDRCCVSTADTEGDALAREWLVDAGLEPHRHTCPVCLALTECRAREDVAIADRDRRPDRGRCREVWSSPSDSEWMRGRAPLAR